MLPAPLQERFVAGAFRAATANMKEMTAKFVRGVSLVGYGVSLALGVGVPIPILDEAVLRHATVRDRDILAPVIDYSSDYPNRTGKVLARLSYEELKRGEVAALALMHDIHPQPLNALPAAARRQVRLKLLQNNSMEIFPSVLRAAGLGAAGFSLAAMWNFAHEFIGAGVASRPAVPILILEIALIGLLTFILALPGALCAPLGRDLWMLLAGGRRKLPAALGTLVGSTVGIALVMLFVTALTEINDPSWLRLSHFIVSGGLIGASIGLPWLLSIRLSPNRLWPVLLAGLCGGLVFLGVTQLDAWWPQHSYALSRDGRLGDYNYVIHAVSGILTGLGSALGLVWGRLRQRS